jgi:hypothetical protein
MTGDQGTFNFDSFDSPENDSRSEGYDGKFATFHRDNPQVYQKLVELARRVRSKGFESYSIKSLFEQVRWHYHMETNDPDFKLNNNYHSRYARLIMSQEEDLREFFEVRALTS